MQSCLRLWLCWLIVFSAHPLTRAAQPTDWCQVVVYQGKDKGGNDLFEYEPNWLEDFCGSVKTYIKNQTQESLKRVHELQKLIFPFTKPLRAEEVMKLNGELSVIDTGEEISADAFMVKRLTEPSQERIKLIAMRRGSVK